MEKEMEPKPKKETYFPIGPSAISKLLSQLKSEGHQLSYPQYVNPSNAHRTSEYGHCLAELFPGGEVCLFSVPETLTPSLAVDALTIGASRLCAAVSLCPPDKKFEKHSVILRMLQDGTIKILLRTTHLQLPRFTANKQKFSNLHPRVVNVTEKEVRDSS
jgi:hypothetical protein